MHESPLSTDAAKEMRVHECVIQLWWFCLCLVKILLFFFLPHHLSKLCLRRNHQSRLSSCVVFQASLRKVSSVHGRTAHRTAAQKVGRLLSRAWHHTTGFWDGKGKTAPFPQNDASARQFNKVSDENRGRQRLNKTGYTWCFQLSLSVTNANHWRFVSFVSEVLLFRNKSAAVAQYAAHNWVLHQVLLTIFLNQSQNNR